MGILHKQRGFIMGINRGDFIKGQKAQGGFKDDVFSGKTHSLKAQKHFSPLFACQNIYGGLTHHMIRYKSNLESPK